MSFGFFETSTKKHLMLMLLCFPDVHLPDFSAYLGHGGLSFSLLL